LFGKLPVFGQPSSSTQMAGMPTEKIFMFASFVAKPKRWDGVGRSGNTKLCPVAWRTIARGASNYPIA
jgi:hypothetical protein